MNGNEEIKDPIEPEIVNDNLPELSRPSIPVTIDELAVIPDDRGVAIVEARKKIIESLRRASVLLTSPQDWLLFRTKEGAVTAYLQDSGCKRVWQIWGIEITPKGEFEKITDTNTGDFAYRCLADGVCKVTGLFVHDIEGIRYSTEDFCASVKPELKKEMFVKLAAIANRDGNIIRSLTGMKSVAIEFIEDVWRGTGKTTQYCSKGKGYGSQQERQGAKIQEPTDIPAPICEKEDCGKQMKFVAGGTSRTSGKPYPAFWSCPDFQKGNGHSAINDSDYREMLKRADPAQGA
jgi:hypothetical protein